MIPVYIDYATPSAFESTRERDLLGLSASQRRPVRFHAKVTESKLALRFALRTLGEIVWSDDTWFSREELRFWVLDPVITVHPDRVFFEAFSQDQSVYGLVIADREIFETDGEVVTGTTNVDFTAWLWAALAEMRSSRETRLHVDPEGFQVQTKGAGGRFQQKVDLPDDWVRGFLQLQGAMAMPGTKLTLRPVDLLAAIRYLRFQKAKMSPRALRYEMEPGQPARIVLEPWEYVVPLKGTEHNYDELRVIRTWGRRRLRLIEGLLPYAESVDVYLKGRALPSFYVVHFPGVRLVLGLSGWTGQSWTGSGSFDLSTKASDDELLYQRVAAKMQDSLRQSSREMAETLSAPPEEVEGALTRMCRLGCAIYDVENREYRHRELFEAPIDEAKLYPPDPRKEAATTFVNESKVQVASVAIQETRKTKKLKTPEGAVHREIVYRDWNVIGRVADESEVRIVVNDVGRVIFGTCGCTFFKENLLNKGPCAHMVALHQVSDDQRKDMPTSTEAEAAPKPPPRDSEEDEHDDIDDEDLDEE